MRHSRTCRAALLAVTLAFAPTTTGAQAPASLKVGSSQTLGEIGLYVGIEKGYFRDLGLDVEIVPVRVGPDALAAVTAGAVDIVIAVPESALFNAFQRGVPLRVVAAGSYTIATIIARKTLVEGGQIKTFADLKGKSFALPSPVSPHHIWFEKGAARAGIRPDEVNLTYLSFPDMVGALANARIDAAYLPEPFATRAIDSGAGARWLDPNTWHPGMMVTIWIYSERLAKDADKGGRFMVGLLKGTRDALRAIVTGAGRADMIAALAKHTQIKDPKLHEKIEFVKLAPDGEIRMESLKETHDWLVAKGLVKQPVALESVVDQSFVKHAVGRLGPYK